MSCVLNRQTHARLLAKHILESSPDSEDSDRNCITFSSTSPALVFQQLRVFGTAVHQCSVEFNGHTMHFVYIDDGTAVIPFTTSPVSNLEELSGEKRVIVDSLQKRIEKASQPNRSNINGLSIDVFGQIRRRKDSLSYRLLPPLWIESHCLTITTDPMAEVCALQATLGICKLFYSHIQDLTEYFEESEDSDVIEVL